MSDCFVAMPITTPADAVASYGDDPEHFRHVLEHLFVPAIEKAGFTPLRPLAQGADLIQAEIIRNLEHADVVLCDISLLNPNVFFELGIRTALDRPVCLVRDDQTPRIPFDTGILNFHTYYSGLHPWRLHDEVDALTKHLLNTTQRANGRNSLWRYFGLTQRGTDAINAVAEDPQQAGLQVILDEIRQLRSSAAPTEATTVPTAANAVGQQSTPLTQLEAESLSKLVAEATPHGPAAVDLVQHAVVTAAAVRAVLSISEISDRSVVFDLTRYFLPDTRRSMIREYGEQLGIKVDFVGGR